MARKHPSLFYFKFGSNTTQNLALFVHKIQQLATTNVGIILLI